jgi:hypothetical protein
MDDKEPEKTVTLPLKDWRLLAELLELGIKTAGAQAFIPGGTLLQDVVEQVNG